MAKDNTCECCRLGLAFAGPGRPVVVFRNIFEGGVRDHAIMTFADSRTPGEIHRVSKDDWQISGCPHQGPSLSISQRGLYHVAWYTNGSARKGCSMPTRVTAAEPSLSRFRSASRTESVASVTSSRVAGHGDGLEGIRRREDRRSI